MLNALSMSRVIVLSHSKSLNIKIGAKTFGWFRT